MKNNRKLGDIYWASWRDWAVLYTSDGERTNQSQAKGSQSHGISGMESFLGKK